MTLSACPVGGDLAEQAEAVLADGGVLGDIFLGDGSGFGPGGGAALVGRQRRSGAFSMRASAQCRFTAVGRVDRSRAAACCRCASEVVASQRNRQPVSGGDADQRCATHLHGANGVRRLVQRGDAYPVQRMRQAGLVDDVDNACSGWARRVRVSWIRCRLMFMNIFAIDPV
jgi:hypothetical protein